jgi:hypothetical protein
MMVLNPLSIEELNNFFDDNAIKTIWFFIKKSLVSQPEKLNGQGDLPIHIPKEHIEQWVVQSLGVEPVGAGSYPIDVKSDTWGADVKMLSCKVDERGNLENADSGETSLAQKFNDNNFSINQSLDELFRNRDFDVILDSWKKILVDKYRKVQEDFNISDIYYFFILRAGSTFYLCGIRVNLDELNQVFVDIERSTKTSVWIKNFLEDTLGHTKIYKSKKRLELRLRPKEWVKQNRVLTFSTNFTQEHINIKELISSDSLSRYIDERLVSILKSQ